VIVAVSVERDGGVKAAEIRRSSGSRKLDDAATRSALAAWKFASSSCEGTAYPLQQSIAVRYEQRPVYTFSAMRAHAWRKNLQSAIARGCAVTRIDNGVITSCITPADAQDRQMADL